MNNENKTTRKDIIKNIAIVFLAVLLVLTFFSNTIMNYSLPQVSAVYVSQGTISEQIRGSGTIEPAESYEVKFEQTREIESVLVKAGQEVKAGDVLFRLADAESSELTEAQETLDSLELEYEKALLTFSSDSGYKTELLEISNARDELDDLRNQLAAAQSGTDVLSMATQEYKEAKTDSETITNLKEDYTAQLSSVDTEDMLDLHGEYYERMRKVKDAVTQAEKKAEEAQKTYDEVSKKASEEGDYEQQLRDKRAELEKVKASYNAAYSQLLSAEPDSDTSSIYAQVAQYSADITNIEREISELASKSTTSLVIKNELTRAENAKKKADKNLSAAKETLSEETRAVKLELKAIIDELDKRLNAANKKLSAAEEKKNEAQSAGMLTESQIEVKITEQEKKITDLENALSIKQSTDTVTTETQKLDLEAKKKAIEKQREKVNELKSESVDAQVTAKMGGIVESVSAVAGSNVEAGTTAAVINISDKGYILEFSVSTEQARKVKKGDKAEITSWYWGDDFAATLSEIRPDTQNPQTQKILVFNVSGNEITTGQTVTLAMGSKGQPYSTVVPNSAVREDSNGKFVLAMESKSSPLGNRYKAVRYDIEVIVKDDNNTAVNGLLGSEYIITTSTKPISAGEQVRPAEG